MKQLKLSSTILHASKEVNILQKNTKTKTKKQNFLKIKRKIKRKVL
jgi:phage anti-repressor protein